MIRVLFILIAFLMIIAGAIGALYYWGIDPLEIFGFTPPTEEGMQGEQRETETEEPSVSMDFGPLIVPVVWSRDVIKKAELLIRLEIKADKEDLISENIPRLQNIFLIDMMGFIPTLLTSGESRLLDNEKISHKLLISSEKVMGSKVISRVIVEQSVLR